MPTYVYKREDGTTFEVMQRITEDPLSVCPTTGQRVKRVIGGGAGLIFKGNGFYLTDYARKDGSAKSGAPDSSSGDTATSSPSGGAAATDSTSSPASKNEPE